MFVTVTQIRALCWIHEHKHVCLHVLVNIAPVEFNASSVAQDLNKRSGVKIRTRDHSNANVNRFNSLNRRFKNNLNLTACNCHGHADKCVYSEEVDSRGESLDIHGLYDGGGVCQDCRHNTKGINCNQCKDKFYRPYGKHWNETNVCSCKKICFCP